MTAAQCTADANTNKALDCGYSVENNAISLNAESNTLIKLCMTGKDNCKQCSGGYNCPYVSYMKKNDVDYESRTMTNPFYRQPNLNDCLLLKLY